MPEVSSEIGRQKCAKSAITNGDVLPGVDGRSTWARRLRDLIALHVADLGGDDNSSAAERAIIRRASVLIVELERLELSFAEAEGIPDLATLYAYQQTANGMRRLLESVGLERRAKDVSPRLLSEIMAEVEPCRAPPG
jgi:hypothetical protein